MLRREFEGRQKAFADIDAAVPEGALEAKLRKLLDVFSEDTVFLSGGLRDADEKYNRKFNIPTTSKAALKELCWDRVEYNTLLQQSQSFYPFF